MGELPQRGRPRRGDGIAHNVTVRFTTTELDALRQEAQQQGTTVSALIRDRALKGTQSCENKPQQ